jgi:hypothetical protein
MISLLPVLILGLFLFLPHFLHLAFDLRRPGGNAVAQHRILSDFPMRAESRAICPLTSATAASPFGHRMLSRKPCR